MILFNYRNMSLKNKRNMKKLFILLLSLSLSIMANAYDACIDGIYYNFNKEAKTASVTCKELKTEPYTYPTVITDYSGDIVIPSTVTFEGETYVVNEIGHYALEQCSLTSLTIPSTITAINSGFGKISMVKISDLAVWCNIDFQPYSIPTSPFSTIGLSSNPLYYGAQLCVNGELITTDVVIPEGVETIGTYAFYGFNTLERVNISSTVKEIGRGAFCDCSGLVSVTIANGVKEIGIGAFANCKNLISVDFPNSVTSIEYGAFENCSNLTSVTLGCNITKISEGGQNPRGNVFCPCSNLMTVKSYIKEPYHIEKFNSETYRKGKLIVPYGTKELYSRFDGWRDFLHIEEMEEWETNSTENMCATPTIVITNNKVRFECETPDAEFTSTITTTIEEHSGSEVIIGNDNIVFTITVYANAPGYKQSKPAKATINVSRGDVNVDGSIDVADIATIISIMASKSREERIIEQ